MSLGVLNNLSAVYAENNLTNTNNSLDTVLQQLSSGSKINSGADDAAGLSLVDGLQANQQALAQSQTNATEGVGLLQVADGALSQVTSLLNRAVTLATEASNGTLNASQDTAANGEYQSILSEINNIGTTTTYNQDAVFNSKTAIYTGDSSSTGASVDSLNIRSLSSANVGDSSGVMSYANGSSNVFIDLSSAGHNASLTDSLGASTATTTINVGYMTSGANGAAVAATAAINVGAGTSYGNTVQGLISAINNSGLGLNATFATAAQAGSAAVANALASVAGGGSAADTGIQVSAAGIGASGADSNGAGVVGSIAKLSNGEVLGGSLSIVGSDGTTHNITLGTTNSTDTLANLASTINAAGYGVTAAVNSTSGALQFTTADSNVSVNATNLAENTVATTLTPDTVLGSAIGSIAVVNTTDTLGGALTLTEGVDALGTTSTLTLGTTTGGVGVSTDTIGHLEATINANTATTGITASLNASAIGTLGQAGYQAANTVLTMYAADGTTANNNTAKTLDVATPAAAVKTALTDDAAAVNGTAGWTAAGNGNLGVLTVAAAGDLVGGSAGNKLALKGGDGSTDDITLTTGETLQTIAGDINGKGYGVQAVLNSTNTSLTFYETGEPAATPVIDGSNLPDVTPAVTGTTSLVKSGSGTDSLGYLTVGAATDTLTGSFNITDDNSSTLAAVAFSNQTLQELAATINGTAAYGITATLTNSNQTLTFTATSTDTGTNPIITNNGAIAVTSPAVSTTMTMSNVPTPGVAPSTELGTVALSGTLTGSIAFGTLASNSITIGATDNTGATLASTINAGNYGVTASYANGTMTFTSANSAMTVGLTNLKAGGVAVGALQGTPVTSSGYYSMGISSTNGITDTSTSGGTSNVGVTTDSNGTTGIATISYADGAGANLSATDLSSQTDAEGALTSLNAAISNVAAQDGYIGAQINTLNSVSTVLSTQQENVQSAQNAVQSTDYAQATSNMSKYEILSQTGIAALAQANSQQQDVLKLLQ
jgi:flagellin